MVNSQWELLSQEIRDPENIPLPNLQLSLVLISLVYLSLQWYLGNQLRSNTGQFPYCYQISKISLQAIQTVPLWTSSSGLSWTPALGSCMSVRRSKWLLGKGQERRRHCYLTPSIAPTAPSHPNHSVVMPAHSHPPCSIFFLRK